MEHDTVRQAVQDRYATIAEDEASCCGPSCCASGETDSVSTAMGYDETRAVGSRVEAEGGSCCVVR